MSSSFILNHDESHANNTLDFIPDDRYKLLYHWFFVFLNGISLILHCIFITIRLLEWKEIKKYQIYITGYSVGLGTFSLSLLLRYVNRIYYYYENRQTALECLLSSPWMSLYMPSVLFLNFCMLFLSTDQLLTMISLTKLKSERKRTVMHQLIFSAVISALSAVWLWTSAFLNSNKLLSRPGCNFSSVVTFAYNVVLHFFCALMGYLTIFIFLCIYLLLWKHHKNTLVASTVRYKRAVAVTKRVSVMVLMTFVLQSIPVTFTIVYYFTKQGLKLRDFSWISESICFPFAAVFFIFTETRLGNQFTYQMRQFICSKKIQPASTQQ
ncbi:Ammonium transporter Amt2 [Trichinella spiralis]|uniref:Ammonium transporter Amt2 n=1 Tax=Trichinella spiralis TaxID=6334 RepID=A0ABR3KQK4_TRISP